MENTVAQVSRYLDRIGAPQSSGKHALLMVAFCRALRRHAAKSTRLKLVGVSGELPNQTVDDTWIRQLDARLDLQNIVRQLSERNGAVLMLRATEYEWKEIAQLFGVSVAAVRNSFWREMEKIRQGFRNDLP
jgi:DNA-directed RNA polymerase specialized sigma24 family protein